MKANDDDRNERPKKKGKVLPFEKLYLERIPQSSYYEKSYMHRDSISQVVCAGNYLITASVDGYLKFWQKIVSSEISGGGASQPASTAGVIEFLKTFRAHSGPITSIVTSSDQRLLASLSVDQSIKIFDILTFDMLTMFKLEFVPEAACWIMEKSTNEPSLLVSDKDSSRLFLFSELDGKSMKEVSPPSNNPTTKMVYNSLYKLVISVDKSGRINLWNPLSGEGPLVFDYLKDDEALPPSTTHLEDLIKSEAQALSLTLSHNQEFFCIYGSDRNIRIFRVNTGKLYRKYDESLMVYQRMFLDGKICTGMDEAEFTLRIQQQEADLERTPYFALSNCVYDESDNFLLFPTPLGIKVLNLACNKVARIIGNAEQLRFINLALCHVGGGGGSKKRMTLEMAASNNPAVLLNGKDDVEFFLAATAFKRNRFFLFSQKEISTPTNDRDVVNEKPIQDETVNKQVKSKKLPNGAILRTTLGDIHITLFGDKAPLAVENFSGHSKSGYYENVIFHRVIKGFMVQTGDPLGDGTGGTSIWNKDFIDEFDPSLRHDQPGIVSMANAGRNTNGSQFFITTAKSNWLDDKHTIFAQVTKGMDVVSRIEAVDTDSLDKPVLDIKILQIDLIK